MKKSTNPYAKKSKRRLRITRKQWIAIIVAVVVIAIIAGILVAGSLSRAAITDPHAGHNHAPGEDCSTATTGGHYEGDGHNHGTQATANPSAKVKYQLYTNADKTYRLVLRGTDGKTLFEADKLSKSPMKETVDADKGIFELSWATGQGPNDYDSVFYNEKTGQVSEKIHAYRGTDGVRIAYGSADQKKVIVQDLFNKNAYYKEYPLEGAHAKNGNIIVGGKLQSDKKTVVISYFAKDQSATQHATIKLYE